MANMLKAGKAYLKANPVTALVNQHFKSYMTKRRYALISKHYRSLDGLLQSTLAIYRPWPSSSELKILFLGTDYFQDGGGMLQALQALGKVTVFTKEDGTYGMYPAHHATAMNAYYPNSKRLREIVKQMQERGEPPDLIIGQMWGMAFDARILDEIRQRHGSVVLNIAMDDRHTYWGDMRSRRWMGSSGLIPYIDMALTAAPECVEWYAKEGGRALFFPEASDPNIFYPMPELPKIYDVTFVGARYGMREMIVHALRKEGIAVSAFGNEWEGGRLPTEDVPRVFAQSRIILGVGTIGHCKDFYALKLRDFDAPMSGSFYLTSDNPDLYELYEIGREIEVYRDVQDCINKVKWYLAHEYEREAIAAAGRQRALRDHTWIQRFSNLFSALKSDVVCAE